MKDNVEITILVDSLEDAIWTHAFFELCDAFGIPSHFDTVSICVRKQKEVLSNE